MDIEHQYEDRVNRASRLLPAWFVPRMMDDQWFFGLLLTTGQILRIVHIDDVVQATDGAIWIDAEMEQQEGRERPGQSYLYAPTSRLNVSVNAAHVVAAFELADT